MSLKKKSTAQFTVVSVNDPAIDRHSLAGQIALRTYMAERGDPDEQLLYLPGARPTKFVCKPIKNQARIWCEGFLADEVRHTLAFCAALVAVDDPAVGWQKVEHPASWGEGATVVSAEAVAQLADMLSGKIIEEVGAVALRAAQLTADQKKAFWPLPGCEVDWAIGSPATARPPRSVSGSESS